ncbi:MAG: hypothetical protein H6658_00770 [Ardenticatenaceae bacterium]|nr:hypothetical protein [Ardenticatenaceae bacterium]
MAVVMGLVLVLAALSRRAVPLAAEPPVDAAAPQREVDGEDGREPTISFIDSPNATCSLPVAGTGDCYIQWGYLSVTAVSGAYIISMTVTIDNQLRAYHGGFFQNAMYIPAGMTAPGYRVSCGALGSGGKADWGRVYAYTIRARETTGLSAANYGSVACPADVVNLYLPFIQKP